MGFKIKSNDRIIAVGRTGSGKSFLTKRFTRSLKRLIVIDPKGEMTAGDFRLEAESRDNRHALIEGKPARILFQPDVKEDSETTWQRALELAYDAADCTVYIDEMYLVVPPASKPPQVLTAIITTGRTRGVGIWTLTQRPAWIPLFAVSEADHYFCFRLTLDEDRKRMASFMGGEVMQPIHDKHGFFYSTPERESPAYFQKLEV